MRLIHRVGAVTLGFLLTATLTPANAMAATPATCTAAGSEHCLSIENNSNGHILSWRLLVYNPGTHQYERKNCLYVRTPVTDTGGKRYYYTARLTEGQTFLLESYLDRRDCGGDMWAGQGWRVGRGDKYNYTTAKFTMSQPPLH